MSHHFCRLQDGQQGLQIKDFCAPINYTCGHLFNNPLMKKYNCSFKSYSIIPWSSATSLFRYFFSSQHIGLCKNASFWKGRPDHCDSRGLVPCQGNYPGFCTKMKQTCRMSIPSVKEMLIGSVCPDQSDIIICRNGGQCEKGFFGCRDNRTCIPSIQCSILVRSQM